MYLRKRNAIEALDTKKSILFLINPKSGVGGKRSVPRLVRTLVDKSKFNVTIRQTRYVAHACELTLEAVKRGVDIVVAVGGDGTVNEVARSLVGSKAALGIVPCGSGNGLARHLGIPLDVKRAIEFINTAEITAVDYGKINGHPFFCTCGIGFDALVSNSFAHGTRRGFLGYMNQTLVDWLSYEPEVYELESESFKKSYKAFLVACGNAAQYGNNAYISPHASMRDGLLSVTVLEPFPAVDVPLILGQLFGRSLDKNGHIKTLEAKWLKIKRNAAGPVHFDGEPAMMDAEIFVEMVPLGLNVLASPGWDGLSAVVPMYKQVFELVNVPVPDVNITMPKLGLSKLDLSKMELPKVETLLPKINIDEIKGRLPQISALKNIRRNTKDK